MMKLAALALLATLASTASALDWTADPVAQARASVPALTPPPLFSAFSGTAGSFDSYVFSLEWTPAFCEGKSGLPECRALPGSFAATHLALHGMWPDRNDDAAHKYGYCGVDAQTQALDRGPTWCRMPDVGISAPVMSRLSTVMSGTQSCLQNHEWYKHGSCSGLTPDDYFTRASALVDAVAASSFGRFLTANAGKTVSAADLLAAFESDFGAGTRARVSLSCTSAPGGQALLDVRVRLANPLRPASELAAMLLPQPSAGNCPPSFLIDPVR